MFAKAVCLAICVTVANSTVRVLNDQVHKDTCLSAHNALRRLHPNTKDLEWDNELAKGAEKFARYLAGIKDLKHSKIDGVGENLWMQSSTSAGSCGQAVLSWYNEEPLYNYKANKYQPAAGHFTQVVWKGSRKLGVGIAVNERGRMKTTVIVARYTPPGNVRTRFLDNVSKQKRGAKIPSKDDLESADSD